MNDNINGDGPDLSGLYPTPWELEQLDQALAEIGDGEPPDDYAGWDDLANEYDLAAVGELVDAAGNAEALRREQDLEDALTPRRNWYDKWARAVDRIESGSYTTPSYYREPEPEYGCGIYSELDGRCSARYHTNPACIEVLRHSAATSDATAAREWNRTLNRNQAAASALQLANRTGMDWDEQLGSQPNDLETLDAMRALLGIGGRELTQPARADAGTLRADLGLY
jgi:hypothetical protein